MQSGKQELGHIWKALGGYRFVDLNDFVDEVHRRDRDGFYAGLSLMPFLDEQGHETLTYYQMLGEVEGLHAQAQAHELAYVQERLAQLLTNTSKNERVVLSWGYAYQLMQRGLNFDHMFVFQSDTGVWCDRIRRAFQRLGWKGDLPTDRAVMQFAATLELDPVMVLSTVRDRMPRYHTIIDTSPSDWGEANLRANLAGLGW